MRSEALKPRFASPGMQDRDATVRAKALSSTQQVALKVAQDAATTASISESLAAKCGIAASVNQRCEGVSNHFDMEQWAPTGHLDLFLEN